LTILSPKNDDETLPIINKSKHPKKEGEYKEYKARTPSKKTKEPSNDGKPSRNTQVLEPPLFVRSISNNERGGPP
jgi:hypothetical protein